MRKYGAVVGAKIKTDGVVYFQDGNQMFMVCLEFITQACEVTTNLDTR